MVLKRLFAGKRNTASSYRIPPGRRIYAIGDIHGRLDLLDDLLERIDEDDRQRGAADTALIFLGDLIDRGPSSSGVIDRLISLRETPQEIRFLMGNHEEVFLLASQGDVKAMRLFVRIGGMETILSYGITEEEYRATDFETLTELFARRVPVEHVSFVSSFEDYVEVGDYLFVHAGIRPGIPIEAQTPSDLRWIRDEFLRHGGDHGRRVVHGHSVRVDVEPKSNRIGIDTGAYASNRLSAVGLEGDQHWFLSTLDD